MRVLLLQYIGPFIIGFLIFLVVGMFGDLRSRQAKRMTLGQRLGMAAVAGLLTIGLGKILR